MTLSLAFIRIYMKPPIRAIKKAVLANIPIVLSTIPAKTPAPMNKKQYAFTEYP